MSAAAWLEFQRRLTGRLLAWSVLSVAVGLALQLVPRPFWRAFGAQSATWGAIDAAIALGGRWQAEHTAGRGSELAVPAEVRKIRRLLWVNAGLDVLYLLGGLWLALRKGRHDDSARGHGWGVAVQGAFLLVFDVTHALHLQKR